MRPWPGAPAMSFPQLTPAAVVYRTWTAGADRTVRGWSVTAARRRSAPAHAERRPRTALARRSFIHTEIAAPSPGRYRRWLRVLASKPSGGSRFLSRKRRESARFGPGQMEGRGRDGEAHPGPVLLSFSSDYAGPDRRRQRGKEAEFRRKKADQVDSGSHRPNFFIVGAPRSGTTFLYHALKS